LLQADIKAVRREGIKFGYWNYLNGGREAHSIASPLAGALRLEREIRRFAADGGYLSQPQFIL
jgi:hypothetical protein